MNIVSAFLIALAVVSILCRIYDNKVEYDYYADREKEMYKDL